MNHTITELQVLATAAAKSGLMPQEVKGADAALYIMAAGQELGLAPLVALRTLRLVKGRISIAAETMLALAVSRGVTTEWHQQDNEGAVLTLHRSGHAPYRSAFTIADAKKAGLGGDNWSKYPAAMLRARAISAGVRAYCPDVVTGLYTPEEIESFSEDRPQIASRQPAVQIEARPTVEPMQIAERPGDAKPSANQAKARAALEAAGLYETAVDRFGADELTWEKPDLLAISKMLADHRAKAAEPEPEPVKAATVSRLDARRMMRIRECDAAGVLEPTIERHGDPAKWDHAVCDAIKGELAALVSA